MTTFNECLSGAGLALPENDNGADIATCHPVKTTFKNNSKIIARIGDFLLIINLVFCLAMIWGAA